HDVISHFVPICSHLATNASDSGKICLYYVLSVSHASFAEFAAAILEYIVSSTACWMKNKAFASLFRFSLFVVSSDVESAHPLP
ncbi:hypothetical protein Tco_1240786, partial [Tanacetum coccineum]